jgi:hypothetical protein
MNVMMVRAKIKEENVADAQANAAKLRDLWAGQGCGPGRRRG